MEPLSDVLDPADFSKIFLKIEVFELSSKYWETDLTNQFVENRGWFYKWTNQTWMSVAINPLAMICIGLLSARH